MTLEKGIMSLPEEQRNFDNVHLLRNGRSTVRSSEGLHEVVICLLSYRSSSCAYFFFPLVGLG